MTAEQAIQWLTTLLEIKTHNKLSDLDKWHHDVKNALSTIFHNTNTTYFQDFCQISYIPVGSLDATVSTVGLDEQAIAQLSASIARERGLRYAQACIESAISYLEVHGDELFPSQEFQPLQRFQPVMRASLLLLISSVSSRLISWTRKSVF